MKHIHWADITPETLKRARELRNNSTVAEKKLWSALRRRGIGRKFRRQQPIGRFIADFYCPEHNLVIEVDGDSHAGDGAAEYDRHREEYLRSSGCHVKRYANGDVLRNLGWVTSDIQTWLDEHESA